MNTGGAHDEINLARLVRRLEKSAAQNEWKGLQPSEDTWLKAEGVLQRVKFARKLLKNCEEFTDADDDRSRLFNGWRSKLDHVESAMKDVRDRVKPEPPQPPLFLPSLPVFAAVRAQVEGVREDLSLQDSHGPPSEIGEKAQQETIPLPTDQLLLSPSDSTPLPSAILPSPLPTLIPSKLAPTSSGSVEPTSVATGTSRFLQTSNALHQELSEQLAQMAVQLKRNALHFSDSLANDKAVVEEAQQKLESNFDVMQKERIRLRDHRGKSSSTTWMTVAILLAVVLLFSVMVLLIRLTRTI